MAGGIAMTGPAPWRSAWPDVPSRPWACISSYRESITASMMHVVSNVRSAGYGHFPVWQKPRAILSFAAPPSSCNMDLP
jgi:hypothetical protein